jgi:hypothetical protein
MSCSYGSEKKQSAPDFINPNDIGVLCFLFGLEGSLCRLLDLVPSAIKKIATLNPDIGNADEVFGDILKSVAKKSLGLLIDSITGQIEVEQYCLIEPPPQPDDITFSDIFIFIAELVPTLDYFFQANEILTGDSTRILDKIVAYWLRKKWFECCQCKPPEPDDNGNLPDEITPPDFTPPDNCPPESGGGSRCKAIYVANNPSGNNAKFSCHGFWLASQTVYNNAEVNGEFVENYFRSQFKVFIANETVLRPEQTDIRAAADGQFVVKSEQGATLNIPTGTYINGTRVNLQCYYSRDGITWLPFDGAFPEFPYPPCPPPPPPPKNEIPPKFCELFPDDPLCNDGGDGECLQVDIEVVEFNGCGQPRSFKTVQLLTSGDVLSCEVVEFVGCNQERQSKFIEYFECQP